VDEPDRDGVQEVQLLPAPALRDDEAGVLEHAQVLHHAEARHVEARLQRAQRLRVLAEELVEQVAPGRIGQGPEHVVHGPDNT